MIKEFLFIYLEGLRKYLLAVFGLTVIFSILCFICWKIFLSKIKLGRFLFMIMSLVLFEINCYYFDKYLPNRYAIQQNIHDLLVQNISIDVVKITKLFFSYIIIIIWGIISLIILFVLQYNNKKFQNNK